MVRDTTVSIMTRDQGDFVNGYVVLDSPGVNSIAGSVQWDNSLFEFDSFMLSPHLLSFNGQGNIETARWSFVNDIFAKDNGFLAFLIGCNIGYEMRGGAIALFKLNKRIKSETVGYSGYSGYSGYLEQPVTSLDSIKPGQFPIRWSAADKNAAPVNLIVR